MPYFDDKDDNYEKLADYCSENNLIIGGILNKLIHNFLIEKGVIKKRS